MLTLVPEFQLLPQLFVVPVLVVSLRFEKFDLLFQIRNLVLLVGVLLLVALDVLLVPKDFSLVVSDLVQQLLLLRFFKRHIV